MITPSWHRASGWQLCADSDAKFGTRGPQVSDHCVTQLVLPSGLVGWYRSLVISIQPACESVVHFALDPSQPEVDRVDVVAVVVVALPLPTSNRLPVGNIGMLLLLLIVGPDIGPF